MTEVANNNDRRELAVLLMAVAAIVSFGFWLLFLFARIMTLYLYLQCVPLVLFCAGALLFPENAPESCTRAKQCAWMANLFLIATFTAPFVTWYILSDNESMYCYGCGLVSFIAYIAAMCILSELMTLNDCGEKIRHFYLARCSLVIWEAVFIMYAALQLGWIYLNFHAESSTLGNFLLSQGNFQKHFWKLIAVANFLAICALVENFVITRKTGNVKKKDLNSHDTDDSSIGCSEF